uniref:Uncharacterized protein n=1 Tax=Glossina pallidipes TaxID=7398 RepID=A0A1A9Z554_GLOPL
MPHFKAKDNQINALVLACWLCCVVTPWLNVGVHGNVKKFQSYFCHRISQKIENNSDLKAFKLKSLTDSGLNTYKETIEMSYYLARFKCLQKNMNKIKLKQQQQQQREKLQRIASLLYLFFEL